MRGQALIAPGDKQMRVVRNGTRYTVSCMPGEKVSGHCPSVDALFLSMAQNVRCRMVGIIMTGMGSDGAKGLLEMRKKGGLRHAEGCAQYRCGNAAGIMRKYRRCTGKTFGWFASLSQSHKIKNRR